MAAFIDSFFTPKMEELKIPGAVVWRDRVWSTAARMHHALVVVAIVVFALFLYYWNLLGIRG